MKKIDLHVHTIPTISDAHFDFSISKLKEYIESQKIDCIAITNHNKFDLEQYKEISSELTIKVFPGIEINFENGHLLLISDDNELADFDYKCKEVEKKIQSVEDYLTVEDLHTIFIDLKKYLLIPHYDKKPSVKKEILESMSDYITAGEVSSVKKFIYCIKDDNSLVPVLFSDSRLTDNTKNFPTKQTYIDLGEITLQGIKSCLIDKNKVFLSEKEGNEFFTATSDQIILSTGLNVILGERSSGKTHTLDKIYEENENVKYIKQFSLLINDEGEFKQKIANEEVEISENFLKEFKSVISDIIKIDRDGNYRDIENYLNTLKKYATETETADIYSKAKLFNEDKFILEELNNIKKLISSVELLIENEEYQEIIEKHIDKRSLRDLFIDLVSKYYEDSELNLKKLWLNDLIETIKNGLQTRSTKTAISEIDLYKIMIEEEKISKFEKIVEHLKLEKEIYSKDIGKFKIVAEVKKFNGAQELKAKSKRQWAFSNAFKLYSNPYDYVLELKKIDGLLETDYYKYFVDINYKVLNQYGFEVSGGERAEFNLLKEIKDALVYDILLIDEPESSFDNVFLKKEVNSLLKEISTHIPVVVVTHNNTVGANIKPNYILYTKRVINGGNVEYKIYSGYPSDEKLKSLDGDEIDNFYVLIDCLEAGNEAYEERRSIYEILKG